MMVHAQATAITLTAMVRPRRLDTVADLANSQVLLTYDFKLVACQVDADLLFECVLALYLRGLRLLLEHLILFLE